jgi:hypothetical protein
VSAPAVFTQTTPINVPGQWAAFYVVVGLVVLHFALITIAVTLFLMKTEMSLLGNAWQAVSQVLSTDTVDVFHQGATVTDREVRSSIKRRGTSTSKVRITKSSNNGRAEVTTVCNCNKTANSMDRRAQDFHGLWQRPGRMVWLVGCPHLAALLRAI